MNPENNPNTTITLLEKKTLRKENKNTKYDFLRRAVHYATLITNIAFAATSTEKYLLGMQKNADNKSIDPYNIIQYITMFSLFLRICLSFTDSYYIKKEQNEALERFDDELLNKIKTLNINLDPTNIEHDTYKYMVLLKIREIIESKIDQNNQENNNENQINNENQTEQNNKNLENNNQNNKVSIEKIFDEAKNNLLQQINSTNKGNNNHEKELIKNINGIQFNEIENLCADTLEETKKNIDNFITVFKFQLDRESNLKALERLRNQSRNRIVSTIDYSHFVLIVVYGMIEPFVKTTLMPTIDPLIPFGFFTYNVLVSTLEGAFYNKLFRSNKKSELDSKKLSILSSIEKSDQLLSMIANYKGDFIEDLDSNKSDNAFKKFLKTFTKADIAVWSMYISSIVPDILSFYKIGLSAANTMKLTVVLRCIPFFTSAYFMTTSDNEIKQANNIMRELKNSENTEISSEKNNVIGEMSSSSGQSKILALVFSLTSIPKQLLATVTSKILKENTQYKAMGDVSQIIAFIFGPLNVYLANNAQERVNKNTENNIDEDSQLILNFLNECSANENKKLNELTGILAEFNLLMKKVDQVQV